MTSKFLIPLKLLNITATPANPTAGFVSLYMKNNYITSLSSSGVVRDVVLDRPLTGFVSITPAQIVATDTVLIAFEKIQAQINNISSGQPNEYYQDLIFNAITAGTGISVNYNDTGNAFTISSTITQGPLGSGTNNYLARWTPNSTTLGTSIIQDNGTNIGVGKTPTNAYKLEVEGKIYGYGQGLGSVGITGENYSEGAGGIHIGVKGFSYTSGQDAPPPNSVFIGGQFTATGSYNNKNYSVQLQDGTQTTGGGKFLKDVGDGKANWSTLTLSNISDYTAYTLPTATSSVLGGIKIGSGLTITSGVVSVTPTPSYAEVITFDKLTPTTGGVVFSPNTPSTTGLLYVSGIDSSTWIWNGTTYITENVTPTVGTAWFLSSAPTVDAGSTKTADILRSGSLNIQGTYSANAGITTIRPGNVYISGDGNNTGRLEIRRTVNDATSNGAPTLLFTRLRGTASSNSYPLAGDSYGKLDFNVAGNIEVVGIENYGASARGSDMIFRVGALGAGSDVERLRILQNGKLKINNIYSLPNVDGTPSQVLTTDGSGVLSWTTIAGGSTLAGSGIDNRVARWTPDGLTLGTGLIRDDNTSVIIIDSSATAIPLVYGNSKLVINEKNPNRIPLFIDYSSTYTSSTVTNVGAKISAIPESAQTGSITALQLRVSNSRSLNEGLNIGVSGTSSMAFPGQVGINCYVGTAPTMQSTNISNFGAYISVETQTSTNDSVGVYSSVGAVTGGGARYALQLQDGSQAIGKFLKNVAASGKANWASITAADISGVQGTLTLTTTGTSGAATLAGNTLNIPQYPAAAGIGTGTTHTLTKWSATTGQLVDSCVKEHSAGQGISIGTASTINLYSPLTVQSTGTHDMGAWIINTHTLPVGQITGKVGMQVDVSGGAPYYGIKSIVYHGTPAYTLLYDISVGIFSSIQIDNALDKTYALYLETKANNASFASIGAYITVTNTLAGGKYALHLKDGSETTAGGRFLKDMGDGKVNFETSFTINSSKVARFDGQVASVLSTNSIPLGTTQVINWNNGNSQTMNLGSATGNVALTFTNPVAGATYFLRVVQGTTPRQISFSTVVKFPGGTAPTLTAAASAIDTIVIFYDGVSYFGNYSLNYI